MTTPTINPFDHTATGGSKGIILSHPDYDFPAVSGDAVAWLRRVADEIGGLS